MVFVDIIYVFYNGQEVYSWSDNTNLDCPEDLCWGRDISEIFYSGVKVGEQIAKGEL